MDRIGFENMKALKEKFWFDINEITLLIGTNNSGKSSVINGMQLLFDNIDRDNLDALLATKFTLGSNQERFGSIASFVNEYSSSEHRSFKFFKKSGLIETEFVIEVVPGVIEYFGFIRSVKMIHTANNLIIFELVKPSVESYECSLKVNFKYFWNRFEKKCQNTELYFLRKSELDQLVEEVNAGKRDIQLLKSRASEIEQELSVYIEVNQYKSVGLWEDDGTITKSHDKSQKWYCQFIALENNLSKPKPIFDEVLIHTRGFAINNIIKEEDYENDYKDSYLNGLWDFNFLFRDDVVAKARFESLLCKYYEKDINDSYRLLCEDFLTVLSNTTWTMRNNPANTLGDYVKQPVKEFLEALPSFGLIPLVLQIAGKKNDENQIYSYMGRISAFQLERQIDTEPESMHFFRGKAFDKIICTEVIKALRDFLIDNEEDMAALQLCADPVSKVLNSDISESLLNTRIKIDGFFVGSHRTPVKRSYKKADHSDFVSLLTQINALDFIYRKRCLDFINKWLKEFDIADSLEIVVDPNDGNFKAYLVSGEKKELLGDYGTGTNQILPILFSLGLNFREDDLFSGIIKPYGSRLVVLEEPEANLHPALQSKLAELFVDAVKTIHIKIIVETHSEYLVRKMQFLMAGSHMNLNPSDVSIYYFNKASVPEVKNGVIKQVEKITIDKYGSLSRDFGPGFFDEADNIAIELFLLTNQRNN